MNKTLKTIVTKSLSSSTSSLFSELHKSEVIEDCTLTVWRFLLVLISVIDLEIQTVQKKFEGPWMPRCGTKKNPAGYYVIVGICYFPALPYFGDSSVAEKPSLGCPMVRPAPVGLLYCWRAWFLHWVQMVPGSWNRQE